MKRAPSRRKAKPVPACDQTRIQ